MGITGICGSGGRGTPEFRAAVAGVSGIELVGCVKSVGAEDNAPNDVERPSVDVEGAVFNGLVALSAAQ